MLKNNISTPGLLLVAAFTLFALAPLMYVSQFVTGVAGRFKLFFIDGAFVTGGTVCIDMLAMQQILSIAIVLEDQF